MNLTFFQSTCSPSTWQWLYNKDYSTWINCRFDLTPQWELRQVDYTYRPCNPSPWSHCRARRPIPVGSWSLLCLLLQQVVVKQLHKHSNVRVHAWVMYGWNNLPIFLGCVEMFLTGNVLSASWTTPNRGEGKLEKYACDAKFSKKTTSCHMIDTQNRPSQPGHKKPELFKMSIHFGKHSSKQTPSASSSLFVSIGECEKKNPNPKQNWLGSHSFSLTEIIKRIKRQNKVLDGLLS